MADWSQKAKELRKDRGAVRGLDKKACSAVLCCAMRRPDLPHHERSFLVAEAITFRGLKLLSCLHPLASTVAKQMQQGPLFVSHLSLRLESSYPRGAGDGASRPSETLWVLGEALAAPAPEQAGRG